MCVLGGKAGEAATSLLGMATSAGRRNSSDEGTSRPLLGLAETLDEGVRVTGSMAAAAVEELLACGTQERFAEEHFVAQAEGAAERT